MEFTNLRFVFHDGTETLVTMRNRLFHELSLLEAPSGLPSHYMNLNTVTWPEWTSGNVPEDLVKILKGWIKAVKWSQSPDNAKEYFDILKQQTFKDQKYYFLKH